MEQAKVIPSNERSVSSPIASERLDEAKKCARLLLGCYRTGDANDPEVYIAAVVAVLSNYPAAVMRAVCDPVKGLPSQTKWLPTIAEVVEACQRLHEYDIRIAERQKRIDEQLASRQALPAPPRYSATKVLTYREAEEIMAAKRGVRVLGPFDQGRTIAYRG